MPYPADYDLTDLQGQWNWITGRLAHVQRTSPTFKLPYTALARMPVHLMCSLLEVREKTAAVESVLDTFPLDLPRAFDDTTPACVFSRQTFEPTSELGYDPSLEHILAEHIREVRAFLIDLERKARDLRLGVAAALSGCLLERQANEQAACNSVPQQSPSRTARDRSASGSEQQRPCPPDCSVMQELIEAGHVTNDYEPITPSISPCPNISPPRSHLNGKKMVGPKIPSSPTKLKPPPQQFLRPAFR